MQFFKELLKLVLGWTIIFSAVPVYFILLIGNIWLTFQVNGLIAIITALASFMAVILLLGAGITVVKDSKLDG